MAFTKLQYSKLYPQVHLPLPPRGPIQQHRLADGGRGRGTNWVVAGQ